MASFGGGGGGFEPASLKILKVEKREEECCWVVEAISLALKTVFQGRPSLSLSTHLTGFFPVISPVTF